jgi:transcriptional regulator with XRE-family HTH domain
MPTKVAESKKAGMPFADSPIAEYLTKQIEISVGMGKNQREIAQEIGYDKPNMISMFKRGEAKVPLDKIPLLARSLNIDAAFLFRLALQQYWPNEHKMIAEIFGTVLTRNEAKIINHIRTITKGSDPDLSRDLESKLRAAFKD